MADGRFDTGETEHGGREIDETDHAVGLAAGLIFLGREVAPFLREVDDERNVETGVGRPAFAAGHAAAVIAVVENNGVLGEAGRGQFRRRAPASASASLTLS
jgi:hypothetical protein